MSASATPLKIDTAACDRCGRCVPKCRPKALRVGPGYIYIDWVACDACGRCAEVCDTGAIVLRSAARASAPGSVTSQPRAASGDHQQQAAAPHARAAQTSASPRRPRAAAPAGVAWSLPEALLVAVVAFALLVGVQSFVAGTAGAPWSGIALLAYDAALVALLWYLARRRGVDPSAAYRLSGVPDLGSVLLAPVVAAGCWLFSVTYRALVLAAGFQPPASEGTDLTRIFVPGPVGAVLTVLTIALLGPALEELLLRGVVLGALTRRVGTWPAIAVSALAFAALHASVWSLLPLAVLGVGLGWLASRSRSLVPAIVAHVIYNGVLVAAALYTAAR